MVVQLIITERLPISWHYYFVCYIVKSTVSNGNLLGTVLNTGNFLLIVAL
jgi:hypothetical protein